MSETLNNSNDNQSIIIPLAYFERTTLPRPLEQMLTDVGVNVELDARTIAEIEEALENSRQCECMHTLLCPIGPDCAACRKNKSPMVLHHANEIPTAFQCEGDQKYIVFWNIDEGDKQFICDGECLETALNTGSRVVPITPLPKYK